MNYSAKLLIFVRKVHPPAFPQEEFDYTAVAYSLSVRFSSNNPSLSIAMEAKVESVQSCFWIKF
jgi:hypothetical protein